jgi:integrase
MLRLVRRPDSPYFYARGSYLSVRVFESLGTCDRGEAETLIGKMQKDIFEGQARGGVQPAEGFVSAASRYMESGGERRFIAPLLRHFGDLPIDRIDQQAIDRIATALYPNGSTATRNRQVYSPLSAILKFAGMTRNIRRPKAPPGIVRWLTQDEAQRLLAACSPHLRPLVIFLLHTGARIGEALWLDWRCVDLARAHVSFPKTKNGDPRGVPLHRELVSELANLPHRDGAVFRRPDGEPYERSGSKVKTAFKAALRRAGLKDFRVHDCRHTWATWHYTAHHDLIALQKLGGWRSLAMVSRYAHANVETYRKGIEELPSLCAESAHPKISKLEAS